ncbi:short-chain fatty acid transporter [Aquisalibacillus elongatus]|uniref:Short-chain fatty acids transporter n=1 Tax=Aquisalibacillus elongatus TaxID=485577 RepID=A0A3N5BBC6_9BACI|nr:TIGR00366 family protein [Aquisalibacillus elongatus]RPF54249.1 short-chain fatty acids transporter [Aquisalibacillus elongatus]
MRRMTNFFTNLMNKYLPDPFVIAVILTAAAIVLGMVIEGAGFIETTEYWGNGFWDLLGFTMQMTLILLTGYVLAKTPLVDNLINKSISGIRNPKTAVITATLFSGIGSLLNWGFGLIIGGIVAQKLAIQVKGVHYPLIIAAGYSGFSLYGLGLSGTVPVTIATPDHFLAEQIGVIPVSETIFSLPIILTVLAVLISLPIVNAFLHPKKDEEVTEINPDIVKQVEEEKAEVVEEKSDTLASRLNNSHVVGVGIGIIGMIYIIRHFTTGGALELNTMNFLMLFLGILLMGTPARYLDVVNKGIKTVAGIVLQYPFYAGIMAILVGTGLVTTFANSFVSFSTAETLPFWSMVSAFFINILAPSGGGQWAVQGPIMLEAASELGTSVKQTALAVQIGDGWNNVVQPFWILPVLAISKLKLKDVMGYLVVMMIWLGLVFGTSVLLTGFLG